jgi:hypothetical protein
MDAKPRPAMNTYDGRQRPVMSPYKQAIEGNTLHSLEEKKRKAIKAALLKPQPRGVFLTQPREGALAIMQDSLVRNVEHTAEGQHSRDPVKSRVFNLPSLKMEAVDHILTADNQSAESKILELLRQTYILVGLDEDSNEYVSPKVISESPSLTASTIHVRRHTSSRYTKCISFVSDGKKENQKTFQFESNDNKLYIEKNKDKGAVYLRLEFNTTEKKQRSVRECVLVFNGFSSLGVQQRKKDQVKDEKASWETASSVAKLSGVTALDACLETQSERASRLITHLDEKFPAFYDVPADGRGDEDAFSPDAYMPYHRAALHNICKLHCTLAYLRALAAVLLRDTSAYPTSYSTFESIVNQVQAKIEEGVKADEEESSSPLGKLTRSVAFAADFVSSLAKFKQSGVGEEERTALNAHIRQLYVKGAGLEPQHATYENLGHILAVRLFETINPSEMLRSIDMSWIEDFDANELSGHEWEVGFILKLHINDTQDLQRILGDDVAKVLPQYNFFNETKDPQRTSNQHAMLVKYSVAVPYVFTVHQPYVTLHGTTVH